MPRHPQGPTRPAAAAKRRPLPPKVTARPTPKPQPKMMLKQHRGGR